MWRGCDTNNDKLVNVQDVAQILLGIDRRFDYSNIATNDMTGTYGFCTVQQILSVGDLLAILRALMLNEHYHQVGCDMPTCP